MILSGQFIFSSFSPLYSYGSDDFYSIQKGSIVKAENARKQYDSLNKKINVESAETFGQTPEEINNVEEKALLHQKRGNHYVSEDDYKNAASEFIQALSLYDGFSEQERLRMAIYISWGHSHEEAISELRFIVSQNPENYPARIHLAKVLSWAGRFGESLDEVDSILLDSPGNLEALLIKANSLRWRGNVKSAIHLYRKLLEEKEDFDVRLGLTYALLSTGNIKDAKESYAILEPKYPYHEIELEKLDEAVKRAARPHFDIKYNYYSDSDDNRYNKYWLTYNFLADKWRTSLNYRHMDAKDNESSRDSHELFVNAYSQLTESLGAGGGLGIVKMGKHGNSHFLTWNLKADTEVLLGKVGAGVSRDSLTETAQLIENGIRVTNIGTYISQNLTDRLSFYVSYNYRDYSDDNYSNELQFVPSYKLYTNNPRITVGYGFRHVDFKEQSGGGYFDPQNFISHQVFSSLYFENEEFYAFIKPYIGHQSFKRNNEENHDWISGGYGSLGFKIFKGAVFEVNAEGGNFALESAAGFRYYLIGVKILFPFI
jgi:thioredoxin-like negative regulator of GroEL